MHQVLTSTTQIFSPQARTKRRPAASSNKDRTQPGFLMQVKTVTASNSPLRKSSTISGVWARIYWITLNRQALPTRATVRKCLERAAMLTHARILTLHRRSKRIKTVKETTGRARSCRLPRQLSRRTRNFWNPNLTPWISKHTSFRCSSVIAWCERRKGLSTGTQKTGKA